MYACPGEEILFECVTIGSQILAWMSEDYIGQGTALNLTHISRTGAPAEALHSETSAMLMDVSIDKGSSKLTAMLKITVLESIKEKTHSVACLNIDVGTNTTVSFGVDGMYFHNVM